MNIVESGKKKCVLVAEDNKFQRNTLLSYMETCDYDCIEAEDGIEALKHMRDP